MLLDVNMPEMNGYEVCRQMKADDALRSIPVIFISALSEPFDKLQAFTVGGVDYVTKPFHLDEVRVRIETHLALRQMQGRLETQNRELLQANERMRALEEARRVFAAAIVHDLKNPLAAIICNIDYLLTREDTSEEQREVLGDVLASSNGAHRIALNLLDVARMEDAELRAERRPVRLGVIVERARVTAHLTTRMTGHPLVVEADADAEVNVDADLLTRILENLLDNSLKYAPKGTPVRLVARATAGGGCSVRVEDHGRGVPPADRDRIFERYVRLDRDAQSHSRTSRGLGLAFCRLAAAAHGGRVWVEDGVPDGAAFLLELPGAPAGAGSVASPASSGKA